MILSVRDYTTVGKKAIKVQRTHSLAYVFPHLNTSLCSHS